ncbi:alpha/beta hydrolase [Pendulispora albinea]|uniref:Alpha/beta hydrolase n=2 Tax=Pendulispora albinea TaxID=2741071 RepID=A0ABZ2MCV2_9BACT
MVHGWQASAAHLAVLGRRFIEAGFRVVTFDMPAHGKSEGEETDITEITELGLQLSDRFGPFAAAVGHSYGAICLVNMLHLGVSIERLILLASPATYHGLVDRTCVLIGLSGKVRERFLDRINRRYAPYSYERDFNAVTNLSKHPIPTLVIHDSGDHEIPVGEAELLRHAHPQVNVMITSRLGHNSIVKAPAVVEACLSFIRDETGASPTPDASIDMPPDDRHIQGENR